MTTPRRRRTTLLALIPLTVSTWSAASAAPADPPAPPDFTRVNVDTAVQGAGFTVVGEVFADEQNLVTTGFGTLSMGMPSSAGSLQVYRPRANLADWRKVSVFDAGAGIIFPNQPTLSDMDEDGDTDIIVPGGYFFDSFIGQSRGTLTWWENQGASSAFVRHDVLTGQPWAYHGVQHVDLDGDGVKDLLTVGEQGGNPSSGADDQVQTQFLKGAADHTFAAPVALGDVGGSLPVVEDVDGDDDLDVVTAQYFDVGTGPEDAGRATFLWLEQGDDEEAGLSAGDFTAHTIATLAQTETGGRGVGMGFQIRPVPGFRGAGTVSWIGTNHTNRCTQPYLPAEQVLELVPPADPTQQWAVSTLSNPVTSTPTCPDEYKNGTVPLFPGENITSRPGYGQGAPGVFGYGDLDGDGDVDLAVAGDGDRRLFWIEQLADGATVLHTLTDPGEEFGQAGGAVVVDLDEDGSSEIVFSSFDRNTLALWRRTPVTEVEVEVEVPTTTTVETVRSHLAVTARRTARKTTYGVTLAGATGGPARRVVVTFDPAKGSPKVLRTLTLGGSGGDYAGKLTWRPTKPGRLVLTYAGTTVSPTLRDTAARASVKVRVSR